ncbi:MAG: Chaperone protein DnaJ [Bacteroidia bacterium]|nr:Chaperone protein DnaJ [Bacteroidia bacterium]
MMYDYYKILGVERDATVSQIRLAYRKKAKLYHPDVNKSAGAHDFFTILNTANDTLTDQKKRKRYDLKLEYEQFRTTQAAAAQAQPAHRDPAYRRKPQTETPEPDTEEKDYEPSGPLFQFFLFSIMFVGMLCFFIPSLAVYYNVINYGVLLLFFPGYFMIRDSARSILSS